MNLFSRFSDLMVKWVFLEQKFLGTCFVALASCWNLSGKEVRRLLFHQSFSVISKFSYGFESMAFYCTVLLWKVFKNFCIGFILRKTSSLSHLCFLLFQFFPNRKVPLLSAFAILHSLWEHKFIFWCSPSAGPLAKGGNRGVIMQGWKNCMYAYVSGVCTVYAIALEHTWKTYI